MAQQTLGVMQHVLSEITALNAGCRGGGSSNAIVPEAPALPVAAAAPAPAPAAPPPPAQAPAAAAVAPAASAAMVAKPAPAVVAAKPAAAAAKPAASSAAAAASSAQSVVAAPGGSGAASQLPVRGAGAFADPALRTYVAEMYAHYRVREVRARARGRVGWPPSARSLLAARAHPPLAPHSYSFPPFFCCLFLCACVADAARGRWLLARAAVD
jgi:hypothetical protein